MAHSENVMVMMKQYLSSMNKRIEELTEKTSQLEAQLSKLSQDHESASDELRGKIERFSAAQEQATVEIAQAKQELKKQTDELQKDLESYASYDAINDVQSKMEGEIERLRDEKLDRSDFKGFVESTFTPLQELFQEGATGSFAEFASEKVPTRKLEEEKVVEPEVEPTPPETVPAWTPAETQTRPPDMPPSLERRGDKKKKKWL